MPRFRTGIVERVAESAAGLQVLEVRVGDDVRTAVLYLRFAAAAAAGDRVVLNTTAVDLGLGSGGYDFVVWNLAADMHDAPSGGHIMKLRYTPAQTDVLAVEAPEATTHEAMAAASSVDGMPVAAASLHSQLLPVVACLRARAPGAAIAYVMTDGGALDASFSRTVRRLRELGWIAGVVTAGNAFGGDLDAVSVYSALLASRTVLGANVAVVGMGPGVVGTATPFGTTAVELGTTINAAAALGGRPVAAVRMSSGDPRVRHAGVSHHAMLALSRVALARADVAVPAGRAGDVAALAGKHRIVEVDTSAVLDELRRAAALGLEPSHMGRGPDGDATFFEAAGAAGIHAASLV